MSLSPRNLQSRGKGRKSIGWSGKMCVQPPPFGTMILQASQYLQIRDECSETAEQEHVAILG